VEPSDREAAGPSRAAVAAGGTSAGSNVDDVTSVGWRPGWDGHLVLLHDDEPQRRAGVAAWVRRGLELGSKILYTEPPDELPDRSLPELLRREPDALEAMDRGQVQVVTADLDAYDPALMAARIDGALSEGYPSVRWGGDAATAWGLMPRSRHELTEQATDELCAARPLSVLCVYRTPGSGAALGPLGRAHAAGVRGPLFHAAPVQDGLALAGELDASNQETVRSLLETATAATAGDPFVLDLRWVDFLDLPGARALLFGTLDHRSGGGRVLLQAPQPHVAQLIRLLGLHHEDGILAATS
jgi:anti-anti-sigma factor